MSHYPIMAVDADLVKDDSFKQLLSTYEIELPDPLMFGKYPTSEELTSVLLSLEGYDARVEQKDYLFVVIEKEDKPAAYFVLAGTVGKDNRVSFYFQGGTNEQHQYILQHIADAFNGTYLWMINSDDQKPLLITPKVSS